MKALRVHYTTTAAFAPINRANIAGIVNELKELNHPGIKYSCWLLPDGKTFMHYDQFENDSSHEILTSLKSFGKFDRELWAGGLEVEPCLEMLDLVSSTETFFD